MKQNMDLHKMRRGISSEVRFKLLLRCIARGVVCTLSTLVKKAKNRFPPFLGTYRAQHTRNSDGPFCKKGRHKMNHEHTKL
jgi:predicted DNA-binding ribbon-helix-helix protein